MDSKYCPKCKETKHIDEFHKSNQTRDGRQGRCKKCRSIRPADYALYYEQMPKMAKSGLKYCAVCDQWLPFSEYRKNTNAKDGCHSTCIPCRLAISARWRDSNREHVNSYAHAYGKTPQGRAVKARTRYKRKNIATENSLTLQEWAWILETQGNRCIKCGTDFASTAPTRDHVVPLTNGGGLTLQNFQALCRGCNASKGNRTQDDYRDERWWVKLGELMTRDGVDEGSPVQAYNP
jgi:5-methylcytosine-specific restriction endonuclease McrA